MFKPPRSILAWLRLVLLPSTFLFLGVNQFVISDLSCQPWSKSLCQGDYEFEQALPLRCRVAHRKGEPWVMSLVSHRPILPCSYSSFKLFWYTGIFLDSCWPTFVSGRIEWRLKHGITTVPHSKEHHVLYKPPLKVLYWLEGDRHSNEKGLISIHLQICWFWWQIGRKGKKIIMNGLDGLAVCKHFFGYTVNGWVEFDVSPWPMEVLKIYLYTPHLEEAAEAFCTWAIVVFFCMFSISFLYIYTHSIIPLLFRLMCKPISTLHHQQEMRLRFR